MKFRMVIPGVIRDDHNLSTAPGAEPLKMLEKRMKRQRIKPLCFTVENQFAVPQTDGAKITDTFACWVMQQNRTGLFGRYPHQTTRTMLLEMNLIGGPQIHARIDRELLEFFYMPLEAPDPLGQSRGAVSSTESPGT